MFKQSSLFIRIMLNLLVACLIILSTLYVTTMFHQYDKSDFITLLDEPKILNTDDLAPTKEFDRGDGIILEYHFQKKEIGCYAEYQNVLVGPVNIQLPSRRSQFLGTRGTTSENVVKVFAELPRNMPRGDYTVQMNVYPTCDGIPRDAFTVKTPNLVLTVK